MTKNYQTIFLLSAVYIINVLAAPNDLFVNNINSTANVIKLDSTNSTDETDLPVKYNGAQLWRVGFHTETQRNAVADLETNFGMP